MRFPKDNTLLYMQDFRAWRGIPDDVDFEVTFLDKDKTRAKLTAPGYGGKPYGNGAIYISKGTILPKTNDD